MRWEEIDRDHQRITKLKRFEADFDWTGVGFPVSFRNIKVQMKCFFIAEFERAAKIRKIKVYRFLISLLVPELQQFKEE